MSYKKNVTVTITRTIYISECPHDSKVVDKDPPKERFCTDCNAWIPYKETSYTGPEIG